jgi:hypothetical protein
LGMNSPQKRRKKDGASSAAVTSSSPAPQPPLAGTVLEVSRACQTYQRTNTTWKRKNCAIEDCSQFQSSTGCKFLNSDGMCYTTPGQTYCKLNAKDPNCRTKESGAIAKALYEERPECKPAPPTGPFTLNLNCGQYSTRRRARYLPECRREDCTQARSRCCLVPCFLGINRTGRVHCFQPRGCSVSWTRGCGP